MTATASAIVDQELLNNVPGEFDTRKLGSDSLVLPVELNLLAHPDGTDENGKRLKPFLSAKSPRFQYSVESYQRRDRLRRRDGRADPGRPARPDAPSGVPFSFDPTKPGLAATSGGEPVLADDSPGATLSVKLNRSTVGLDGAQGLLLIHHLNKNGSRAEVVAVSQDASKTALALSASSAGYWSNKKATATVTIVGNATKPNGGTVQFKDGTKVIATGTLVAGKATVLLPRLTIRTHHLTASYVASASLAGSTSAAKTLVVTKSKSTAKLTVTPTTVSHTKHAKATIAVTVSGSLHRPSGTVKVFEGSKLLGSGTLVNGKLTLTLPLLAKGSHVLKAQYLGDSTVAGDTSSTVTVKST